MTKIKKFIPGIICLIAFIAFTFIVKCVDVQSIGPMNSSVGLASLNTIFNGEFNPTIYKLTQILGLFPIFIAVCFACCGLCQLIKRKSLAKVDKELITLAIFYIIVIFCYFLFEKVIINFRPVILKQELEASYPSSHTMLALFITLSAIPLFTKYISNKKFRLAVTIICVLICALIVVGRLTCHVHWFTDIIGGILLSLSLFLFYIKLIKK